MPKVSIIRMDKISTSPWDGKLITNETFSMRYEYKGKIKYLFVPRNFVYNGASIPILQSDYNPKYLRAALVHDYLCKGLNKARKDGKMYSYSVREISCLFGAILREDDNGKIKSWLMEKAVYAYKTIT